MWMQNAFIQDMRGYWIVCWVYENVVNHMLRPLWTPYLNLIEHLGEILELDSTLYLHKKNTKWGNIFGKNGVNAFIKELQRLKESMPRGTVVVLVAQVPY